MPNYRLLQLNATMHITITMVSARNIKKCFTTCPTLAPRISVHGSYSVSSEPLTAIGSWRRYAGLMERNYPKTNVTSSFTGSKYSASGFPMLCLRRRILIVWLYYQSSQWHLGIEIGRNRKSLTTVNRYGCAYNVAGSIDHLSQASMH